MILEPTGERMIVEHYRSSPEDYLIYLMHMATYSFAERFTTGKRVLDYGCGSGYGSSRIAESALEVVGVDVAADAVAYAREKFQSSNLSFETIDPELPLPFGNQTFDTVLSFQVFEHVSNTDLYLTEIKRVLKPDGHLMLVTPDRTTRLLPFQKPWNRWHLKEYDSSSLQKLVSVHFPNLDILHMSAPTEVIEIELRRCRKLMWTTLPFTLPFFPDPMRISLLNFLHSFKRRPVAGSTRSLSFDFDESAITIDRTGHPSVNLVAIAKK